MLSKSTFGGAPLLHFGSRSHPSVCVQTCISRKGSSLQKLPKLISRSALRLACRGWPSTRRFTNAEVRFRLEINCTSSRRESRKQRDGAS